MYQINFIQLIFIMIFSSFLFGCSGPLAYSNTPYESYTHMNLFDQSDSPVFEIARLVRNAREYPEDFNAHWKIAQWTFSKGHLGTCLFALNECLRIRPGDQKVNYNIGVLMGILGLNDGAKGRLLFIEKYTKDFFIKNRAVAALMSIDEGKKLKDEYFIRSY